MGTAVPVLIFFFPVLECHLSVTLLASVGKFFGVFFLPEPRKE